MPKNKHIPTKQQQLDKLYAGHKNITTSPLYIEGSSKIVFGEGDPHSPIMLIGEAPGKSEDEQGRPFVGRSGQLLDRMLETAGTSREKVFITNIVKCRPPNNRTPLSHELKTGKSVMLSKQIDIIKPKVICTLGSAALQGLLEETFKMTEVRGKPMNYKGIPVLPVLHPAYILRRRKSENLFLEDITRAIALSKK